MSARGSILRASVLAGLVGAIVQATPFVNIINTCCCALVVPVGVFAAWILRSDSSGAASTLRCGAAGMGAGVVAAIVGVPLGAVLSRAAFGTARLEAQVAEALTALRQFLDAGAQPPPPGFLEAFESGLRATSGLEFNAWLVVSALFTAFVQAWFGLLGGLIGAALWRGPSSSSGVSVPDAPVAVTPPTASEAGKAVAEDAPMRAPEASAAPVLGEDGRPEVHWAGPVLESAPPQPTAEGEPPADDDATPGPRGELPLDELPLLPPRTPSPAGDDSSDAPAEPRGDDTPRPG